MKKSILLFFFSIAVLSVSAQTTETINELTPVPSNIGKFTKNVPRQRNAVLGEEKIKFAVQIEPVILFGGKKAVAVTIQTNTYELVFENVGGQETARVHFYARITSKDGQIDGFFEENSTINLETEELANSPKRPVNLRKVFYLPSGKYQIGVIVRDIPSGALGVKSIKFQIPEPD